MFFMMPKTALGGSHFSGSSNEGKGCGLSYFSVDVIKYHDEGNTKKEEFLLV